ncbi:MAG: GNAT family protein [Clostridiales bacterium]|nr:GNAT family protein [Clostridiales bacterium]
MVIKGEITNLRSIRKSDLNYIQKWINDLEVQFYAQEEYPFFYDPWFIKYMYNDGIKGKRLIFMIEDKDGDVIGELWLFPMDYIKKTTELVITIGKKELRGIGYGKDAINTAKKFCFNHLRFNSIYLKVFSFNIRAIRCYKSCGFKIVGIIRDRVIRNGMKYDEFVMELKKEE